MCCLMHGLATLVVDGQIPRRTRTRSAAWI